jgi:hypothetical protein
LTLNAHSTEGTSLCQFLPLDSRSWNILVFIPCRISLFVCSSEDVLLMMADGGYQNPHSILQTFLL